jgi:prepilin-type N-terminal cleavage/methylation domain-containing protein
MHLTDRGPRIDLHGEEGFTLPELLVAIIIGMIVLLAAFGLLDTAVSVGTKVNKRVDATQRARSALDMVTRDLRSQVCIPGDPQLESLIAASDSSVDVYVDLGDGSAAKPPQRRTITFDPTARTLTEQIYTPSGSAGAYVFPTTPTLTRTLLRDVVQDGTNPVFTYYPLDPTPDDDVPPTAFSAGSGVAAASLEDVARIRVTFKGLPSGRTTTQAGDAVMQDDVYRNAVDPNSADPTPECW